MIRLHILSDLHIEFGPFECPSLDADVTILAGDIFTKNRCCPWENAAAYFGRPVVMVPGNHEFYGGKIETTVRKLKTIAAAKSVSILDNEQTCISQMRAQFSGVFSGICIINQLDSDHFREVL